MWERGVWGHTHTQIFTWTDPHCYTRVTRQETELSAMPVELKYTRERLLELLIGQRVTDHHDDDIHNIIIA